MNRIFSVLLLVFVSMLAACSYAVDFYIVNDSENPVDIQYKVNVYPSNPALYDIPTKIAAAQLQTKNGSGRNLEKLKPNEYEFDNKSGIVKVKLPPHEALWIAEIPGYGGHNTDGGKNFSVQEISISGTEGELKATGKQTLERFSKVSDTLYTLTYK